MRRGLVTALIASALMAGHAQAAVSVVWEKDLTADMLSLSYPYNNAFEPIVATHPTNGQRLAVVYQYRPSSSKCSTHVPGLRVSTDGGASWKKASGRPWAGSGRIPNYHGSIAWGPGPTAGSARLYWVDSTVSDCAYDDHRLSIAYSDDLGATWSSLFVASGNAQHGYPDITVDRNPASPNYGVVYATMNPLRDSSETQMPVYASKNHGKSWQSVGVSALSAPSSSYPFQFRQGYRLRAAPDGGLYASWCQVDRTSATSGSYGRVAFGVARLRLDRQLGTFTAAAPVLATAVNITDYSLEFKYAPGTTDRERLYVCWTHGVDTDANGRLYLAVADYTTNPAAGTPRGFIRFGRSDDKGQSWSFQRLPSLAADGNGRQQSAHKPTVAVRGTRVFVGFHVLSDVPLSTTGIDYSVTVGNAFLVSSDRGDSWSTPRLVSSSRWSPNWLDVTKNGAGLRDRAEFTAAGRLFWAYGDGRRARAKPDYRWGRGQVYATLIELGP